MVQAPEHKTEQKQHRIKQNNIKQNQNTKQNQTQQNWTKTTRNQTKQHKTKPGACTMMVAEQTQGYSISFELTKPNQSNPALLVPWSWSSTFFVNSGLILS